MKGQLPIVFRKRPNWLGLLGIMFVYALLIIPTVNRLGIGWDEATDLWRGDNTLRHSVLQAFADAGIDAVVAEYVPANVRLDDWHQVGNSSYYIFVFTEQ